MEQSISSILDYINKTISMYPDDYNIYIYIYIYIYERVTQHLLPSKER